MNSKPRPIIIIKKKSGHGGHHGGAWKVAYADFVTAMMALFIVLWLLSSSENVKKAVAGYFNDPSGTGTLLGTNMSGTGEGDSHAMAPDKKIKDLKGKLEAQIKTNKELEKLSKQIEITITPEGLRIELIEGKKGTFYQSGSPQLSEDGQKLLVLLATELKTLPNSLLIEGHTDAVQYSVDRNYSNWELSADRANSARRLLQQDGVRSNQVTQVRGFADQMPRMGKAPEDSSNRRITLLVSNAADKSLLKNIKGAEVVPDSAATALPGTKTDAKAIGTKGESKASPGIQSTGTAKAPVASSPAKPSPAAQPMHKK